MGARGSPAARAPHARRGTLWSATLALLALALLLTAPAAAEPYPPDEVEPPAKGEGQPLDDPSDPPPSSEPAPPAATFSASGPAAPPQAVERLGGATRYDTAVAASRAGWPGGAGGAVLASGERYEEAVAAATLAGTIGAPLLLTAPAELPASTAGELRRLRPRRVWLVGALSPAVRAAVEAEGFATIHVQGADVYDTAFRVARSAARRGADTSTVLVVSGRDFADGLAASALAAGMRWPVLLVEPDGGGAALRERVAALGAESTIVVGGVSAVPDDAVAGLPGLERIAGGDRVRTAAAVADRARALGLTGPPVLAYGERFPDALSGGVLAGAARRAPVLLTTGREVAGPVTSWLAATGTSTTAIVGGAAGVSALAACQLAAGQSRAFLCAEEELAAQGYAVGPVDGRVDRWTPWALYAFQKVAGLPVTGNFGDREWTAMVARPRLAVRRPDLPPDHVEIDIARQLVVLVRGGEVAHVFHTSTGKASTPTVRGTFTIYEKRNYRQANRMYRAVFFYRGYALHGYPEIPLYPASNGCARLYDGNMDVLWPLLRLGERVATF